MNVGSMFVLLAGLNRQGSPRRTRIELNHFKRITVEKSFSKSFVISFQAPLKLRVVIVRLSQMRAVLFITPRIGKLMNILKNK